METDQVTFAETIVESESQDTKDPSYGNTFSYHDIAAIRLNQLLGENAASPCKIAEISVLGTKNTRAGFLKHILSSTIEQEKKCSGSLAEALARLARTGNQLSKLGIYESVSIEISRSKYSQKTDNDIAACIHVKERPRIWARTGTDFGNQEGSAYASANLRNALGGAESLEGNMSFGTRTRTSYELRMTSPIRADPDTVLEILGFRSSTSNTYASHVLNVQGLSAKLKHLSHFGVHEVGISFSRRQITDIAKTASLAVRSCAGCSNKLSLLHTIARDTRDDPLLPTRGYKLRSSQEIAGGETLGGEAKFVKLELDGSCHNSLYTGSAYTLNLGAKSGLLWSTDRTRPTYMPDRFQLGGPQSVRGFTYNGLGPRSGRDSLGGDIYLATAASVMGPIPGAPDHWPLRGQIFLNSGSLLSLSQTTMPQTLRTLCSQPSISAGFGLIFRHPVARVEMSFTLPVVARSSDSSKKGLQFGLGADFL